MRILWVSLIKFPPLCAYLGETVPAHCGWLYASAKALLKQVAGLEMGVAVYSYTNKYEELEIDGIRYFMIPSNNMAKTDIRQIKACRSAIESFCPDIIHIHGTEHSLALAICKANAKQIKMVANIQGLAGPCTRYADGGLSLREKLFNITPLDFYRGTFLLNAKRNMRQRAKCENEVLLQLTDIIGRTEWDYAHITAINPYARYHFMNETLRDSFYEEPYWHFDRCQKHTVFVSNSSTPLKGAHQVLKALPIILRYFPETIVNFCGSCVMNHDLKSMLHFQGYHLYLRKLVKKLGLQEHVRFLGTLSELEMKQAFLDANVYVMPSAIENSPNSLCEAQMLGVPIVASYCGGTPTLLKDGETGYFYRYEEYEMLAQIVVKLFKQTDWEKYSICEKHIASERHNKTMNSIQLVRIYKSIIN